MSRQQQRQKAEQVVIQRLNTIEQEIREIRKAVTREEYSPEFPVIKQEQQQQRQQEQAEQEELI